MGPKEHSLDYGKYYNLDSYLFGVVGKAFRQNGFLSAFDFFCIALVAERKTPRDKLQYLMKDWGFRLPTASAILTVFYPDEFTVYDIRVCAMLRDKTFKSLVGRRFSDDLWREYRRFFERVKAETPAGLSLRDKDRYLWGKSFHQELKEDIETKFQRLRRSNP